MALNPLIDHDWKLSDFTQRIEDLLPLGFRLLSLSMYGHPFDPRFSAVWDKRPGPPWKWYLGYKFADLKDEHDKNKAEGFHPALIAATGGGVSARFSAVYEKLDPGKTRELTLTHSLDFFASEVSLRQKHGWIIKSAAIYDDAANESRVAAVWAKNSANVAWTAFAGSSQAEMQQQFDAEFSSWARLAFITGSTSGRFLTAYRDDQIANIGTGFAARAGLTLAQFLDERKKWLDKGLYTACFQGYGPDNARRYAAIFVSGEQPVARTARATGGPAVPAIDDAVFDLMRRSNIRGAALAIVKGTRLVLARGYTWAEPDYPNVQPATVFRLASGSKLVAGLAIHQLAAEGVLKLTDKVSSVLPLAPPPGREVVNTKYLNGTVAQLLEAGKHRSERYERRGPEIVAAFGAQLPVKQSQIASYMITLPPADFDETRLDDTGYFFAGQLLKRMRGTDMNKSIMDAAGPRLTVPLQIKRIRSARSLVSAQLPDEARYHPRDLKLDQSVMEPARPLVPREYGDENLETMEPAGGLSAAVTDYARLLAAMNMRPYTPLGRPAVEQMLKSAEAADGHGFDWLDPIDAAKGLYNGPKGGLLQTSQAGVWYSGKDFSYIVVWNGNHTGTLLSELHAEIGPEWYPKFHKVLDAAANHSWPATDLFPTYGMETLPQTQDNWRWCSKCQGLFFAGNNAGSCPAGGAHGQARSGNYALMHNSKLPYGQPNWRWCKKCQGLFFGGAQPTKCPAGNLHDSTGSGNYNLVVDSPYKEHQRDWRRCKKCQGLFFAGQSKGVCPAGGAHDQGGSGDYSLARV